MNADGTEETRQIEMQVQGGGNIGRDPKRDNWGSVKRNKTLEKVRDGFYCKEDINDW